MKILKAKIFIFAVLFLFLFFFSNDFGLIDVEKTAIITAIAVDLNDDEYEVTAQIAVPEANDTNTENKKAQISGSGKTVGAAIKNLGNTSGWYPKLEFCNLIIFGNKFKDTNIIKVLDYFTKTLRIQDSATPVLAEKKAKDILSAATPLDNISSFALQKVLFKSPGFDRDVFETDIRRFSSGYYSISSSSMMPLVKIVNQEDNENGSSSGGASGSESGSGGGKESSGGSKNGHSLFDARTTMLFKDGFVTGELNVQETFTLNMLYANYSGSTISLQNVKSADDDAHNYLLTVKQCTPKVWLNTKDDKLVLEIRLDVYCKISDQNASASDSTYSKNPPLPQAVKEKAEALLKENIENLVQKEKIYGCDFLKIKEKLYRYNNKQYSKFKDNFADKFTADITVSVSGQK